MSEPAKPSPLDCSVTQVPVEIGFEALYKQLHVLAEHQLQGERAGHTLQPTALLHEAYLRMNDQRVASWQSRTHFVAVAAQAMRRVLVDHARCRGRQKRGGNAMAIVLGAKEVEGLGRSTDVLALDDALEQLAEINAQHAEIVQLRYFGGLTINETAEALGISTSSVERAWRAAKAWLYRNLSAP